MASVLGISIGTRNVGVAVFRSRALTDYRIRTIAGKWTDAKCESIWDIVELLIRQNKITDIMIKLPRPSHRSENINELVDGIRGHAYWYGINVHSCTLPEIKALYGLSKRSNKRDMAVVLIAKYPELAKERHDHGYRRAYYAKLLEAIACAELAQKAGH